MADEYDPFATSTGLPDKIDVEILESWFEFDPQYQDGQQLLIKFNVRSNDEEWGEAGLGTLMYSTGAGWSAEERGAVAVRDDGNTTKGFNNSSAYALFFRDALDCDGAENVLRSENRGDPRRAAMWVGTSWHLDRKEKDYGGTIGKISRLLPTSFLGENGLNGAGPAKATGAVKKAPTPTKAAAPTAKGPGPAKAAGPVKKAAATTTATETVEFAEGHPLWDTLWSVAWEAADHESFVETAFSTIAGVAGDKAVEDGVMASDDGSLWGKVVAKYQEENG